jgi:hypothetical protein
LPFACRPADPLRVQLSRRERVQRPRSVALQVEF